MMGKITSIYLTDEKAKQLEKFCEENQCTQYSALKRALREMLSRLIKEEGASIPEVEGTQSEVMEGTEEAKQKQEIRISNLRKLARALKAQDRELNRERE